MKTITIAFPENQRPVTAAKPRRRLLFLAPVVPADRGNGLAMRVGFFLQAYLREFDVDLAVFPIVSGSAGPHDFVRGGLRRMRIFAHPGFDSHFALVTAMKEPAARLKAFRRYGRPSLASFAAETAQWALADWIGAERYDVVHVSRLYLAGLTAALKRTQARPPRLAIDCDEDDSGAYRRLAAMKRRPTSDCWAAAWLDAEADAFARLAQDILSGFDFVFASSADEARSICKWNGRAMAVPNVAPRYMPRALERIRGAQKTVLFVGTMGYAANDDGARWLLTRVWPRLRRAFKSPLRLVLVGSNPSPSLIRLARAQGACVTGTVREVGPFYRQADLVVIPIRAGGGTRIKLIEAAAWNVSIVSTAFGAGGTTFRHGRDLLIAEEAGLFARSCVSLLRGRVRARRLAAAARRRVAQDYDADRWARRVANQVAQSCDADLDR